MFCIDGNKCTGCGTCTDICPQRAVSVDNDVAVINQGLCAQCGKCMEVCPADAIRTAEPIHAELRKGGENMPYVYGRGFGFRGASPSWPYVGSGRGGLPRCWHPGLMGGTAPYAIPRATPYQAVPTHDEELGFLKDQAGVMKRDMEEIERRIMELEKEE